MSETLQYGLEKTLSAFTLPIHFLTDPTKRIFWLYLIASGIIGLAFCIQRYRRQGLNRFYVLLMTPRLWLHPSALLDIKLIFTKAALRALLFASWFTSSYAMAVKIAATCQHRLGPAPVIELGESSIMVIYSISPLCPVLCSPQS